MNTFNSDRIRVNTEVIRESPDVTFANERTHNIIYRMEKERDEMR
jgi:hypothetical protein